MKYKEIKNLYERLLPEIKYNLKKNSINYSHSVKSIIAKLHVYKYYGEMTIDEVKTLITYSDIDHHKWDGYDWKWGEKLFKEDKQI